MDIQAPGEDVVFELLPARENSHSGLLKAIEKWRKEHEINHIYGIDFLYSNGYTTGAMIAYRPKDIE